MYSEHRMLLDALQSKGVDANALLEASEEADRSGRSLRDVLINDSVVTEVELTEALAEVNGMNSVDLIGYPIDAAAMAKIPLSLVTRHRILGIGIRGNELIVAITEPDDVVALDDVRAATGMVIVPVVVARSELRRIIDRLKREDSDLTDIVGSLREDTTRRTSRTCRRPVTTRPSSATSTPSSSRPSRTAPPTCTSSRRRTTCACATASTVCCTRWTGCPLRCSPR